MGVYRASTNQPKTAWARHLDQVMRDRDWSRVRLFEEVGAELGYRGKSRSAMLPLLVDKEPDEAKAAVLRKHFGDPPPEEAPDTFFTEGEPTLTRVLGELVAELRESRLERVSILARLRAVEAELESLRARPEDEASPRRPVPPERAGSAP
jgi:hypothetical protein